MPHPQDMHPMPWLLLAAFVLPAVLAWIALVLAIGRGRPHLLEPTKIAIAPAAGLLVPAILVALLLGWSGLEMQRAHPEPAGVMLALCIATVLLGAPLLHPAARVVWDDASGAMGPGQLLPLRRSRERVFIAWNEIARCRRLAPGLWRLEALDGRRIYWNALYTGHALLFLALSRHGPHLRLPFHLARLSQQAQRWSVFAGAVAARLRHVDDIPAAADWAGGMLAARADRLDDYERFFLQALMTLPQASDRAHSLRALHTHLAPLRHGRRPRAARGRRPALAQGMAR